MDKILTTMIGSFLGFFLGLLALALKERLDFNKRLYLFKVAALYLARSLEAYLHEDPCQCSGIDLKTINSYLDGGARSRELRNIYEQLFSVYMDWSRGFYSPTGIKIAKLNSTRGQLEKIIVALDTIDD
jgi:hypothetical protein